MNGDTISASYLLKKFYTLVGNNLHYLWTEIVYALVLYGFIISLTIKEFFNPFNEFF